MKNKGKNWSAILAEAKKIGLTHKEIAEREGVRISTVSRASQVRLRWRGIPEKRRLRLDEWEEHFTGESFYCYAGLSDAEIMRAHGCSKQTISGVRKKLKEEALERLDFLLKRPDLIEQRALVARAERLLRALNPDRGE